jgi:hypothetical protein
VQAAQQQGGKHVKRKVALVVGAIVVACVVAWGLAWVAVWQPTSVARGSWVYALKVPKAAKQWHLWQLEGQPVYDIRHGDGPAPSHTLIRYTAKGSLDALQQRIAADGYACQRTGIDGVTCDRIRDAVLEAQVIIERDELTRATNVTIYIPEY